MKTSKKMMLVLMALLMMVLVGCNSKTADEVVYEKSTAAPETRVKADEGQPEGEMLSYRGELKFTGLNNDFTVPYNEIYAMPAVEAKVKHISSTGEESNQTVKGALLEDILKANGATKKDYTGIRFIAGDGYAVTMPADVFMDKDVILAWAFDGAPLEDKKMPLRVAINDVRSMYYVSNLAEIAFEVGMSEDGTPETGHTMVLMESAFTTMATEEFMYYDSNDLSVNAKELMKAFTSSKGDEVAFVAVDGFEKTETYDVVKGGFIKINGEDAPLFTGDGLPKGMNVKSILKMTVADALFMSVTNAYQVLEQVEFDGDQGVNLAALVQMSGLEGDTYLITATDGFSKEVTQEQLELGMAYVNNSATVTIKFNDDDPKQSKVKNALTITVVSGTPMAEETEDTPKEDTNTSIIDDGWMITFDGLSDGTFDMTQARADKAGKIPMVDVHTEHMKNDVKNPTDWEGYKVLDILAWLKVEDFNSLIVIAGDGYETVLMKDMIDDETILAHSKDGEAMTDPENMVQLVQNTEFATSWVKGVAKIIVK